MTPRTYEGVDCGDCDQQFRTVGEYEAHLDGDDCPEAITVGDRVRLVIDTDDDPHLRHLDGQTGTVERVPSFGEDSYYVAPDADKGPAQVLIAGDELEVVGDG